MKRLVLDTCALIAFAGQRRMRGGVILSIEAACRAKMAFVPVVVALEIAQKWWVGKLRFSGAGTARQWYEQNDTRIQAAPASDVSRRRPCRVRAARAVHKDPADRLVVAAARLLDAPVVTVDRRILAYGQLGHVRTISY